MKRPTVPTVHRERGQRTVPKMDGSSDHSSLRRAGAEKNHPPRARRHLPTDLPADWRHFAPRGGVSDTTRVSDCLTASQEPIRQRVDPVEVSETVGAALGAAARRRR